MGSSSRHFWTSWTSNPPASIPAFSSRASDGTQYLFYDASGAAHSVLQSGGGEQGDPLMPGLVSVGIHQALRAAHPSFQPGEDLLAFLDDTYIICPAKRAAPTFRALRVALAAHAKDRCAPGQD